MAAAGLSTPLHLAASLLALAAAVGLAVFILVRPGTLAASSSAERPMDRLLAAGAFAVALSHVLQGAYVPGVEAVGPWVHAAGLVLIAVGCSPRRLTDLTRSQAVAKAPVARPHSVVGAVAAVPAGISTVAAVSAVAGAAGAIRALLGGRRTLLIGIGLLAWGLAPAVSARSATAGALLTVGGAVAIGGWLWEASAHALLAKFVAASVTIMLAVVVLIAIVLGSLGSRTLVVSELNRLEGLSQGTAQTISAEWLAEARRDTEKLSGSGPTVIANVTSRRANLDEFFETFFNEQDFFVLLNANGRILKAYAPPGEPVLTDSFLLQLYGSRLRTRLLRDGAATETALLRIGGRFVAVGGAALRSGDARPESAPIGAVITGRIADRAWAAQRSSEFKTGVVITTNDRTVVASPRFAGIADEIAAAIRGGTTSAAVTLDGRPYYMASTPINDPHQNTEVGRAVSITEASGVAFAERNQARGLFLLALFSALAAGALAALVTRRLVAPIRRLTAAAAAVREGDLTVAPPATSPDEVGLLERTFGEMTASMAAQSSKLREAANVEGRLRARLEALTRSMSDALVAVDPDGRVVTFNPAAERLLGRLVHEALGHPIDRVLDIRAPEGTVAATLGASDSEEQVVAQVILQRPDGRLLPTAVTAAPVHDNDGSLIGRVLVLRDVTREAEIERMKTEFLSNVSHELRTPLTPIKGYAEVLARRQIGEEATKRFADQILASTGRLERIVGMIVDFAALDSGRVELREETVVLPELVREVLDEWRSRHPEREFRRRLGKNLPPVRADSAMLRRCLDELLDNAVKFSPGGEPISVSGQVDVQPGRRWVRLTVRDRGVGIDPETRSRVFRDFYQGDASETRHFGGLGLGLALVQRIVDGLGGDVDVESVPGRGAAFSLLLPVADAPVSRNGTGSPE